MDFTEKVLEIVREHQEIPCPVTPQSDLRDDAGIDSFGALMVVNALEDTFGITIDEADIEAMRTVSDIVKALERHFGGNDEN